MELDMPIRSGLAYTNSASHETLRTRLAREFRQPAEHGQPLIYLEPTAEQPTRIYVVWEDWRDLDVEERSRIILDAFRDARDEAAMLNLVVALGITTAEAERMKIPAA
jgi:hypothetical protein